MIRQGDVVGPHVELPLSQSQNTAQHRTTVYADPHVQVDLGRVPDVPDGLDHAKSHLDATVSVVRSGDRKSANAVVTVAEKLYTEAVIFGRELVETSEQVVEYLDQFLSTALACQS